jgi:hypothetical protein
MDVKVEVEAPPRLIKITPQQVLDRVARYMEQIPDLAYVLILARQSDGSSVVCTSNAPTPIVRRMMRAASK